MLGIRKAIVEGNKVKILAGVGIRMSLEIHNGKIKRTLKGQQGSPKLRITKEFARQIEKKLMSKD